MKILFTDATLLHGGAERVISILANELIELGYEVEILLYYDRPIWYQISNKVKLLNDEHFIGKTNPVNHIVFRHNYFKNCDADIIISFLAPINMLNITANFFTGKKLIVADRNDPRKIPVKFWIRKVRDVLYRFADGIVLQSTNNKKYFSKSIQEKSAVIFNPVDVGDFRGAALVSSKNDEIVAVGRLIEQKNPFMLLEAFSKISYKYPTYSLTFYGEGDLASELKQRAKELGLSGKIKFPGAVKDVFDKIKSAKIYVMTSNYEGMPNALIEAMCVGVPVISTKVSGAVDLIEDGVNGRLVDCKDTEALIEVLDEMLDNYTMAENYAKESIKLNEKLEAKQIVENWLEFIARVIKHK